MPSERQAARTLRRRRDVAALELRGAPPDAGLRRDVDDDVAARRRRASATPASARSPRTVLDAELAQRRVVAAGDADDLVAAREQRAHDGAAEEAAAAGDERPSRLPRRPAAPSCGAVDLAVVADVHGEVVLVEDAADRGGARVGGAERQQLGGQRRRTARCPASSCTHSTGSAAAGRPDADERGAPHGGVQVEDLLARHAVHRPGGGVRRRAPCGRRTTAGPRRRSWRGRPCGGRPGRPSRAWRRRSPPAGRRTRGLTTGPRTTTSPTSAGRDEQVVGHRRDRLVGDADERDVDARHGPADADARARAAPAARRCRWSATGSASVAPYGVKTCAPSGSIASVRRCTRRGTGAPADMTSRTVGRRRPLRLSVSSSPGEPNITVAPKRSAASTTRDGTTAAGRVASMRGTTVVMPSAGPYSANGGNVDSMTWSGPRPYSRPMQLGLREQRGVAVLDALGRAGAAAGEEDRRGRAGGPLGRDERRAASAPSCSTRRSVRPPSGGPSPAVTSTPRRRRPAEQPPGEVGLGDAEERLRRGLGEAPLDLVACRCPGRRAPARARSRSSAKASAKKSGVGGTSSAVRMPGRSPACSSPAATRSTRASSSAYVVVRKPRTDGSARAVRSGCAPGALGEQPVERAPRRGHAGASSRVAIGTMRSAASSST